MESHLKFQKGYLILVAAILIVIVGFIGTMLVYMLTRSTGAVSNVSQAKSALYVAASGLEMAKRDIIAKNIHTCTSINGDADFTDSPILGGEFTVTGNSYFAITPLSGDINSTAASIPLVDSTGFAVNGIIWIGNELIRYHGISGNTLLNADRGDSGTIASAHAGGTDVIINQCELTSTGAVPTIAGAGQGGKRTLKQLLLGSVFSTAGYVPVIMALGPVDLSGGATLVNPGVTKDGINYAGSTVASGAVADLAGGGITKVNSSGGLVVSSDKDYTDADVVQNLTMTPDELFNYCFNTSRADVSAAADHSYNNSNIDGVTGKTIWVDGNLKFAGGSTVNIGTAASPVILIVNGDFEVVGTVNINFYGFIYVMGDIKLAAGGDLTGFGAMASEGQAQLAGNKITTFDPNVLAKLHIMNPATALNYNGKHPVESEEVFP